MLKSVPHDRAPEFRTMLFHIRLLLACCLAFALTSCATRPLTTDRPLLAEGASSLLVLDDGSDAALHATWWQPAGKVRGVVVLLHGTSMHGGLYAPWASALSQRGYAVLAPDLRGWGQSAGKRTPGNVANYDVHIRDLERLLGEVRLRHPDLPLFLQGESMGGTIALYSQLTSTAAGRPLAVSGLILNSPAMHITMFGAPEFITRPFIWSTARIGRLLPDVPALFVPPEFALRLVIKDAGLRQRLVSDPLVVRVLPFAYLTGIDAATQMVEAHLDEIRVPLLVIHGEDDNLVPLSSSRKLIAGAGSSDKTLLSYAGVGHVSLLDSGHERPWQDMTDWLDRRSAP